MKQAIQIKGILRVPFFFSLLLMFTALTRVSHGFTSEQNKALKAAFRLEPVPATQSSGGDVIIQFAKLSSKTLSALVHENTANLDIWLAEEKRIKSSLKINSRKPVHQWIESELALQHCFLLIRKSDYTKAVMRFREAWNLNESLRKNGNEDFLPAQRTYAVMLTLLGTVPAEYQWVIETLGFEGHIQNGLNSLRMLLDNAGMHKEYVGLREETLYYYLLLSSNFSGSDIKTREILDRYKQEANQNPLLMFLFATQGLKVMGPDYADEILAGLTTDFINRLPHLLYAKGLVELLRLESGCEHSFLAFIRMHKGKMFITSAWYKLSLYYLLVHRIPESESCKLNAQKSGSSQSDEDMAAMREIKRNRKVPLSLIKARIQFDGCLYNDALKTLIACNKQELVTSTDRQEFLYRLARIKQSSGYNLEAIKYYKELASKQREEDAHFIPSSFLQLGILFEECGNEAEARLWYKKVLAEKNFEYERSIKQKAKAGLRRLQE